MWQRRCEDALYSLLVIGARRPVRHLASVAMTMIISKGDGISVYSRASSLQGFLSDGKRSEPQKIAGLLKLKISWTFRWILNCCNVYDWLFWKMSKILIWRRLLISFTLWYFLSPWFQINRSSQFNACVVILCVLWSSNDEAWAQLQREFINIILFHNKFRS